jgi:peptide/nickel transport system ATP-binding protein/oligopeptide transport system ATP-binding protein
MTAAAQRQPEPPLVEVTNLAEYFPLQGGVLHRKIGDVKAVDDVSFTIRRGEALGLVGESGCGKTTVGRVLLRLLEPTAGRIVFDGQDITNVSGSKLKAIRRRMQIIFQDPYASLDPRQQIGASIAEGLRIHGIGNARERHNRTLRIMELVGLQPYHARRYPHEFSGGQRQRIGIARALVLEPDLLVCDEPVSALDVSIQAQVLNLLRSLQRELGLTYLFIAHNMGVVEHVSDRVAVMYLGAIAELSEAREIYRLPLHPYTIALLSAVPPASPRQREQRRRIILLGDVPSPVNPPSGCRFHTRCWLRSQLGNPERCAAERPALRSLRDEHEVACHFAEELLPGARRDQLIADAARTSSPFATSEEESAGGGIGPAIGEPDPFDPRDGGSEGVHGRL